MMKMEVTFMKWPLALLTMALALLLCFVASTESRNFATTQSEQNTNNGEVTWCIAKPSADVEKLRHNLDYCCGQNGIDCRPIQAGGTCFTPDNVVSHASVAMNLFYRATGKHPWDCHFNGTGLIVFQNPSVGICEYPA